MLDNQSSASEWQSLVARRVCHRVIACVRDITLGLTSVAVGIVLTTAVVHATTKGLNQIVTADIQPKGQLSISYQMQDPNIGNREELQVELGITDRFELAAFQGFAPSDQILNAELGIVQSPQWLLSTGILGWTTRGDQPQPFLVGAHIMGPSTLTLGVVSAPIPSASGGTTRTTEALMGYAYKANARTQYQVDYQTGTGNSATAGVTYAITPSLSFNPAVYVSNDPGHKCYGYSVLSYSITAFK